MKEILRALLQWDKETLIFLNSLGTEQFDTFWALTTNIATWIPLFLLFYFLIRIKYPGREGLFITVTILLLLLFILTITGLAKSYFERLRPNNDMDISHLIRIIKDPKSFSFFSGHASSSFAITTIVFLFLRKHWAWSGLFFIWPLLFSFSRIYVGVHFPLDIVAGTIVGIASALVFYFLYQKFIRPYSKLSHP